MKTFFTSFFEIRCQATALLLTLFALSVTDVQGQAKKLEIDEGDTKEISFKLEDNFGDDFVVKISSDNPDVTVDPTSLIFNSNNWNDPQPVFVTAKEDGDAQKDMANISIYFEEIEFAAWTVTVIDDEIPSTEVTLSVRPMEVSEETAKRIFVTAKLNGGTRDLATEVALTVGSGTATADTDFTALTSFNIVIPADVKSVTKPFNLTPINDTKDERDETVLVSGTATGLTVIGTSVTIIDNDSAPAVTLVPSDRSIDEDGGTTTVTATLDHASSEATMVVVELSALSVGVVTLSDPTTLTIAAGAKTSTGKVTLTAVDNDIDAPGQVKVTGSATNSLGVTGPPHLTLTITDDDTSGVTISKTVLTVDERGKGTYTVVLDSEPTGDVIVTVGGTAGTGISVDKRTLTFTTTDWMMKQTVTVTAMEDDDTETDRVALTHAVNGYPVTMVANVTVTVNDITPAKEEKIVVEEIVNVIAASTVSNVTSNIGARFSSVRGGGAVLTLAGQPVNIEQTHSELMETVELYGSNSGIEYGREIQSLSEAELLRDSSFKVALAATEDDGTQYVGLSQWTLWGQGDFQTFQNDSESANYDGDLKALYLGVDTWINEQWLAGFATSRIMVDSDYSLENSDGGNLELTLTGLHPYLRFVPDERSEYWIILGTGDGEIENQRREESEPERNEVKMSMGAAGVRRTLPPSDGGVDLAIIGDAGFGRMETKSESGLETIDNLRLNTWRVRLGVEGSKTKSLAHGATLRSFAEVAGRLDGGAGDEESGLELSVGMFFFNPNNGLGLEVRGRTLLLHSAEDYQEYGGSITGSLSPRSDGLGTNLAVSLRWGAETRGVDTLWREGDIDQVSRLVDSDKAILNSRLGYGIALNRGLLTPYGEYGLHDQGSQHLRVGVDFGRKGPDLSVFSLGLFGERKTNMGGESEHRVNLSGRLRF